MREIKLTQGQAALVDDDMFEYLNQWKWCANKLKSGVYAVRRGDGKLLLMHRFILGLTDSKILGDHIDRNTLNNCRSNLRICNNYQNACNRRPHKNSTSKYLGVSWMSREKMWGAGITKNYKKTNLGLFKDEKEAALAYNNAAFLIHGEFANLNKISA